MNGDNWRKILRSNFTSLDKLVDFLELSKSQQAKLAWRRNFPLNLPRRLASKIEKGSLTDPIFLQFVPLAKENDEKEGFINSPVCDESFQKTPKLLKKYHSRMLLITTSACAMNCRFCFRQNYPYEKQSSKTFEEEINQIKKDPTTFEVILSGGDPLSLSNEVLKNIFFELEQIKHVKMIRFHSRFLIGIPERVDSGFLEILDTTSKQVVFTTHINHPTEIDDDVTNALKSIQKKGVTLLNHSVLLKGVNDFEDTLIKLSQKLSQSGVTPYYLNQLDPVAGAAHFEVPIERGLELIKYLRKHLPGHTVPRYIQEVPGESSKTELHTV